MGAAACPCLGREGHAETSLLQQEGRSREPLEARSLPSRLKVCELFAGIGGWRLALEAALPKGVEVEVSAYDSGPHCSEVYARNFGEACSRRNIEQLTLKDLEGFDIWVMSPPCQPFSTTKDAKQRDIQDKRCKALDHLCSVITRLSRPPRWIALENVKGFYSSDACKKWRAALAKAGFRDREFILDLISFGTPNHRTRYYLLAERSQASPHLVPSPALSASLEELMPAGVLLRGPWAKERRRRLEEAHAAARQASGREATEEVFRAARRTFCEALAALLPAASAGELVGPTELTLQGSSAWKLLPLPRAESDALLLVFDEDGQAGSRADKLLSRLPHDENVGDLVSWSRWPPQGTKQGSVAARPVADFLEESSLAPDERSELMISLELLSKPFAPGLSYVGQQDVRSFCFTGHYGKVMHKASGSLLHLPSGPGGAPLDRAKPATNHGAVRLFSPKEILNFLGFPAAYSLPKDMELKHRYKVVGNSIAVTVASELLRFLLLREGGERLAALEQPPPERQAALAE